MDRRKFLKFFGLGVAAVAATAAIDPEELLWKPGTKTFFLPPEKRIIVPPALVKGDVFTIDGVYAVNPHTHLTTGAPQHFVVTDVDHGGNTFITPQWVTHEALKMFKNNLGLVKQFNRSYDDLKTIGVDLATGKDYTRVSIRTPQRFRTT